MHAPEHTKLINPPGGILVWMLLTLELITFLGGIIVLLHYRRVSPADFNSSREHMDVWFGFTHTLILVSSGYLAARGLIMLKLGDNPSAARNFQWSCLAGIIFLVLKSLEFYFKERSGYGFSFNPFFTLYWLMAGFHFVHVLLGVGMLQFASRKIKQLSYSRDNSFDVESITAYWHLCDLIWIFIFPVFYLI